MSDCEGGGHEAEGSGRAKWRRVFKHSCGARLEHNICDGCKNVFQYSDSNYICSQARGRGCGETIRDMNEWQTFTRLR